MDKHHKQPKNDNTDNGTECLGASHSHSSGVGQNNGGIRIIRITIDTVENHRQGYKKHYVAGTPGYFPTVSQGAKIIQQRWLSFR